MRCLVLQGGSAIGLSATDAYGLGTAGDTKDYTPLKRMPSFTHVGCQMGSGTDLIAPSSIRLMCVTPGRKFQSMDGSLLPGTFY